MDYFAAFRANTTLIERLGEGNAYLIWAMGLYLGETDLLSLASESLTDGPDDKKLDFINIDLDAKRIVLSQGYYSSKQKSSAPANKASDLNTAAAWLLSGNVDEVPEPLKPAITECRSAIESGDIESIELIYVHNLPESVNVTKELQTAVQHFRKSLGPEGAIVTQARELGLSTIERLCTAQESPIKVKETIICPATEAFSESGPNWRAAIMTVPGQWLHQLFDKYGDDLFSANYRGFLGISKRRKINTAIRETAENRPQNFWVYNNGITLLTLAMDSIKEGTQLQGLSIINGAQTTGSIGSVDIKRHQLANIMVLCRIIQCSDAETIDEIVKYNNTQNEITTWDQYSNDGEQRRIEKEFSEQGHIYSRKRGFGKNYQNNIGIEEVAQPLLAFQGRFVDAYRGKNDIFERKILYKLTFEGKSARHILFVYTLSKAIDERRLELKRKSTNSSIIKLEEKQLALLRHLRFKNFFLAIVGRSLEAILGKQVELSSSGFTEAAARNSGNTLFELIAAWSPVVDTLLTYVSTQLKGDFSEKLREENALVEISDATAAIIYASRTGLPFHDFCNLVAPTGH